MLQTVLHGVVMGDGYLGLEQLGGSDICSLNATMTTFDGVVEGMMTTEGIKLWM